MKNRISFTGKSLWAFVRSPEKYKGKEVGYSIQIAMPEDKLTKIKQFFLDKIEEEYPKEKRKGDITIPIKDQKDGSQAVKVRTNLGYNDKMTGEFKPRTIAVLDKYGIPLPKETLVGNGSDVQVSATYKLFHDSADKWGVRFYLEAVKVNELVAYDSYGLTFEDKPEGVEDETSASTPDNEADF